VMIVRGLGLLAVTVFGVPKVLHELTHAVIAAPGADRVVVEIDVVGGDDLPSGTAHIRWRDGVSNLWLYAAALGPSILGTVVGGVILWVLLTMGWDPPAGLVHQLAIFAGAAWWLIYTTPVEDVAGLRS